MQIKERERERERDGNAEVLYLFHKELTDKQSEVLKFPVLQDAGIRITL